MISVATLHTRCILLDIEGTTTPVEFVYQTLFPFARRCVRDFLAARQNEQGWTAEIRADIAQLRREHASESDSDLPLWHTDSPAAELASVTTFIYWLMDRDRKSTGLKAVQGRIWEAGYRSGELRSQVYEDVPRAFARWTKQGRTLAIFSSGSVLAQQLLFAHTNAGDLTSFLSGYFDTTAGAKQAAESYQRIAAALGFSAAECLFLSDVVAELDAAKQAGMQTALCVRAEPAPHPGTHPVINTFDEICV